MAEKNLEQMKEAVAEIREKMAAAAREAVSYTHLRAHET